MTERFSRRHGFGPVERDIAIRDDAPDEVRAALLMIAEGEVGIRPGVLREVLCTVLRVLPDSGNWSEYPNVWQECQTLISQAPWYRVYDFVEDLYRRIGSTGEVNPAQQWAELVNEYFVETGVGWRFVDGRLERRGEEGFQVSVDAARGALAAAGLPTARAEIQEALRDLSRRPSPDLTGAIHHSMAALECTAREVAGDPTNVGSIGMVVNRKQLVGKSWVTVYLLTSESGSVMKIDLRKKKFVDDPESVFSSEHKVFAIDLDELDNEDAERVKNNALFASRESFVGYVTKDSNITTVTFVILRDRDETGREIAEGTILKTTIYGEDTLYQVINGNTREERLEARDSHGFTVGVARKLGTYQETTRELTTRKWMPRIFAPLFFGFDGTVSPERIQTIAQSAIGRLPEGYRL